MPGLVAAVGRGDDIEVVVLGDQSLDGSPMAQDSLFRIASITKPMMAALALTFVADGTVTLEQPVDDLLPELASPAVVRSLTGPVDETVPAARAITVRQLLTSTNGHGFPSDFSAPVVQLLFDRLHQGPPQPQRVPPPDEWMAILADIPLLHQPGEAFTYNTAFDILGVLVAPRRRTAAARPHGDADPRAARDERPPGTTGLCVEFFCFGDDPILRLSPEELEKLPIRECVANALIDATKLIDTFVTTMRRSNAASSWRDWQSPAKLQLLERTKQFGNLYYVNRPGADWATFAGMMAAGAILRGCRAEFDRRADPTRSCALAQAATVTRNGGCEKLGRGPGSCVTDTALAAIWRETGNVHGQQLL